MKRLFALFAPIFFCLTMSPVFAQEQLSLGQLSGFLNDLKKVKGLFTQINDDGSIATGTIYIHRPGRIRFEYDPPEEALVMAGGQQVAIFDPKSNHPPEQYPLRRTPLHLILKRKVDLSAENMVTAHSFDGIATSVTAQDPERPDAGAIQLVFSGPPIELRQWVITNEDGSQTTVILRDVDFDAKLSSVLFGIPVELKKRGF